MAFLKITIRPIVGRKQPERNKNSKKQKLQQKNYDKTILDYRTTNQTRPKIYMLDKCTKIITKKLQAFPKHKKIYKK